MMAEVVRSASRIAAAFAQTTELALRTLGDEHPRVRALRMQRVAADMCRIHEFSAHVRGVVPKGPCVLVSNHGSYIDPLVIASLLPCAPIAKREVLAWPLVGPAMTSLGVLFVDRDRAISGAAVMRAAQRILESGVSVLVFPEGTTSERELRPFRRGMFEIARRTKVPLLPIALRYGTPDVRWLGDDLFFPHYLKTTAARALDIFVEFGEPLQPAAHGSSHDLAVAVRDHIQRMLTERT